MAADVVTKADFRTKPHRNAANRKINVTIDIDFRFWDKGLE